MCNHHLFNSTYSKRLIQLPKTHQDYMASTLAENGAEANFKLFIKPPLHIHHFGGSPLKTVIPDRG